MRPYQKLITAAIAIAMVESAAASP